MSEQNELKPQPAVMEGIFHIKRAATGQVDTVKLTFTPIPEPKQEQEKPE